MKEAVSVLLLAILIFSGCIPALAQNGKGSSVLNQSGKKTNPPPQNGNTTQFNSAEAFTDGNGVFIRWQMNNEFKNAGFLLYRIDSFGRNRVKDNFTVGAAARFRNGNASGAKYRTFDPEGTADTVYEIESVSLDGTATATTRTSPKTISNLSDVAGESSSFFQSKSSPESFSLVSSAQALPYDLGAEVSSFQPAPDPNKQKFVASQPGVKIGVKNAGIYRVSLTELQNAGFVPGNDPGLWQLYTDGVEQAITVGPGGSYIEFYGKPINSVWTDTRTYFLIVGSTPGKRIATRLSRSGLSTVVSQSYDQTFSYREASQYLPEVLNGDADNFWGRFISSGGTTLSFNLSGTIPSSGNVTFDLTALGYSSTSHNFYLTLNGNVLPNMTGFNDLVEKSVEYTIPASYLQEGTNSLQMRSDAPDFGLFRSLSISFARRYLASQNQLSFHTENFKIANLDGFTSPNIRVFDTTVDGTPVLVSNLSVLQNGATYGVSLPAGQSRVFFAVEDSAVQQNVATVSPNAPSALSTTNHSADLVIISYPDFANLPVDPTCVVGSVNYPGCLPPAQQWAVYRRGQGTNVEVAKVDDIFDEFNYGAPSPYAIRDFLNYAKTNWTPAKPQYALLIGDSSYDPKNYLGFGAWNYVPLKSVDGDFGEVDSDDAMADFNDDGLADMAIGRIPGRQAANILDVLSKVEVFENRDKLGQPKSGSPQSLASLGTLWGYDFGQPDPADPYFYNLSKSLADQLTVGTKTFVSRVQDTNANDTLNTGLFGTADFIAAINPKTTGSGKHPAKYIVNYSGHGAESVMGYTSPRLLRNDDLVNSGVPTLTNTAAPSIFVSLSCLNAFFTEPRLSDTSLGELLLSLTSGALTVNNGSNTAGGAVAVWASTGETTPDVQQIMGVQFYKQVNLGTLPGKADPRLGDFIIDAKAAITFGQDVRYSWALLGDPMLKLKVQ